VALESVAEEQEADEALIADLKLQGTKKPTNIATNREAVVAATEPIPYCTIQEGSPFVQIVHSIARYCAPGRLWVRVRRSTINDEYIGAIGDRDGDEDQPFVKI